MNQVSRNKKIHFLVQRIVNPFSPYFVCQHFLGNEFRKFGISHMLPRHIHDLLETGDTDRIQEYDILYVEVRFFEKFCTEYLPKLSKKIVLLTGGCQFPQIVRNPNTDVVLEHPNIALWISQNPIYSSHPKYMAFPYGIHHTHLKSYVNALLHSNLADKPILLSHLPFNPTTHPCRRLLPVLPPLSKDTFYEAISKSKFVLSPIGDRDDCYRHYECIGLGSIPISNAGSNYVELFEESMYICTIETMVDILETGRVEHTYRVPNRDILCLDYHKDRIRRKIESLRKNTHTLVHS